MEEFNRLLQEKLTKLENEAEQLRKLLGHSTPAAEDGQGQTPTTVPCEGVSGDAESSQLSTPPQPFQEDASTTSGVQF